MKKSLFAIAVLFCVLSTALRADAVASSEVSNVISDLRSCKAAWMMYRVDHWKDAVVMLPQNTNLIGVLREYLDSPRNMMAGGYSLHIKNNIVWIGCDIATRHFSYRKNYTFWDHLTDWWLDYPDVYFSQDEREKMQGKSESVGLLGSVNIDTPPVSFDVAYRYKADDDAVWMIVDRIDRSKK